MKTIIVFYSLTGNTKKVAESIAEILKCDIEEIIDYKNRKGFLGFLISGRDAILKKTTQISPISKDISQYEHVIIGTPVWASNITPAIRTFITNYREVFKNVSFFCTMGFSGDKNVFRELELLCVRKPLFCVSFSQKEILYKRYFEKLDSVLKKLI